MNEKTILLIEDNLSDIDLTIRALGKAGLMNHLLVAEDGEAAASILFESGIKEYKRPCLILLDIKLPGIDGIELLKQIREHPKTRRLPVVILTSSGEAKDVARCYDLGVNSYIQKPVDFNRFVEVIQYLGVYWLDLNEEPPIG